MNFQFSELIDPSLYETEGLCKGIPLRRHKLPLNEDIGSIRAQEDWINFVQVTVPECLPDRLEIISYANEFAFLYDDATENLDFTEMEKWSGQIIDGFEQASTGNCINTQGVGKKAVQARIFGEMMAIDPERARTTMKSWATFLQISASRPRIERFSSLEDYLPYRINDAGQLFWYGIVTFGMAITIRKEDIELCNQLVHPGFAALSLTNDLFSWEKERDEAHRLGQDNIINAIFVIMTEQNVSEVDAKLQCRGLIQKYVAEFLEKVERTKNDLSLSQQLRRYVDAIQYSVSGNLIWSLICPRYHQRLSYNSVQLDMMQDGVDAVLARMNKGLQGTIEGKQKPDRFCIKE